MNKSPNTSDPIAGVYQDNLVGPESGEQAVLSISGQGRSRRSPKPNNEAVIYQEIIDPLVLESLMRRLSSLRNPDNDKKIAKELKNKFSSYIITRSETLRILNLNNDDYDEPIDGVVTLTNKDVVLCNSPEHKQYFLSNHEALKRLFDL